MNRCLTAAVVILAAPAATGQPEDAEPRRPADAGSDRSIAIETWTGLGASSVVSWAFSDGFTSDPDFLFETGLQLSWRTAPFQIGLSFDYGGEDDSTGAHLAPIAGVGFDVTRGLRIEGLAEIGAHLVDSLGDEFWEFEGEAPGSVWLLHAGLRLGISGRFGRDTPRIVFGGWTIMRRDLTSKDYAAEACPGCGEDSLRIGGTQGLLALRLGLEW